MSVPVATGVEVHEVGPQRADDLLAVIHAGFGARPVLDPPSTATAETTATVADALARHGGLLAEAGGRAVGAMLLAPADDLLGMRRVAVLPDAQGTGVARALVAAAEGVAARRGYAGLRLTARAELPATVRFWTRLGYVEVSRVGTTLTLAKLLPVTVTAPTAENTRALGQRLAGLLRPGDLLILSGDLGAGKTTFTQGLGAGLGVRGDVTSPTFVISRVHPSLVGGPALVHVDAYRLGGIEELDDLDLDTSLEEAVTVVEWGEGVAEGLADTRLEVRVTRPVGGDGPTGPDAPDGVDRPAGADREEERVLTFTPVGGRWLEVPLLPRLRGDAR